MQSSQEASKASSSQEPNDMDSIDNEASHLRKRTHSEMTGDSDDIEEFTFDILECFPILLCLYVFQHFNASELLEMSTVNREWNKLVGEKQQAAKLHLNINENSDKKLTPKIKDVLMNSKRRYQKIEINISEENVEFLLAFLAKGAGSWKFVSIWTRLNFGQASFPKILEIVEPSVEDLEIFDGYEQDEPSSAASSLKFPRLKHLKCDAFDSNVFKYFKRVTSLVSIRWFLSFRADATMVSDLRTILRNNHNLKKMHVEAGDFRFFEHLFEIKFKLQKFQLDHEDEAIPMQHLASFLKTQASSLESLDIYLELDQTLLELVLGMPRLTSLKIYTISGEIQELPANSTIASLQVYGGITAGDDSTDERRNEEERIAYQTLIESLQNLKHLKCEEIDDELFLFLAVVVPELESIETDYFNVLRVPKRNVFPIIKKFKAHTFRENFREPTGDYNFAKLVRDEMAD